MAHKCHIRYYFTGHPIFKTCHTIITCLRLLSIQFMLLLTKFILLSSTPCHYLQYDAIINQLMRLSAKPILLSDTSYSDTSTTHMLLSSKSCYYQTAYVIIRHLCYYQTTHVIIKHLILLSTYHSYTSYHTSIIIITTGHPIFMIP